MRNLLTHFAASCLLLVALASCEKDEDRVVMKMPGEPALTASATTLNLSSANASQTAITYTWPAVDFGYPAAVTYTLQFDRAGNNFATPYEVTGLTGNSKTFTVAEINSLLLSNLRLSAGTASQAQVRVKASVSNNVFVTSPATTFSATPYLVIINYPSLYVPGNHQGWAPATAPKVSAFTSAPDAYEGYVNLNAASPEFKFTSQADWNGTNYGAGTAAGTLSTNGGAGNLTVPTTGYYRLKANTTTLTWEAVKTTWSVIGSATPGGWNADTPLTYDATAGTWSARVTLTAGAIKFRANNDWPINFGDGSASVPADGLLDYGGSDINVTTPGTYTVTLDLSRPGNYTYSLR
ncbi:SusF/SusE family outer membrane protein [Hymenobacter gummosus]|uniref:SusF/SusE family outer membrane protein n=1 Tax=Hymenobacter gummosus TaxID=1776032 RepID=A0A3S0QJT5_9BACT|nr:SusE domain-containing protein [Hymenobacter gummosus]RTQ52140.1 SusF/SusE family outer membrane protein [Hymenobacter gummosus]